MPRFRWFTTFADVSSMEAVVQVAPIVPPAVVRSGMTLTANSGTGTCSVTATKAADTNYNSATSAAV